MKIALLQLNPTVGDLSGNSDLIAQAVQKAGDVDLAVTSELALLGYPPRDLLLNADFVQRSWDILRRLASDLKGTSPVLVGLAEPNPGEVGRPLFNSAALLREGRVEKTFHKMLLPTYDVFDEDRYFEPAAQPEILELDELKLGISICEDIWNDRDSWRRRRYHTDPIEELVAEGADAVINLSASPFTVGKQAYREAMLSGMAKKYGLPFLYVNQVGGNDELVFDGRSCFFDGRGRLVARARGFEEDLMVADLDSLAGAIAKDDFAPEAEIWRALVLGTRDYVHKCGFESVLLGLSGGIDSSLVAAVAAEAIGPDNVLGVLMPSPYSSIGSIEDAQRLAQNLGIKTISISITPIMASFDLSLEDAFRGLERDVAEENIQARIRGNLLMALSNKYGSVLLTTGNKSELAVGYCTIYGDMSGGLAVISDVPKTMVYRLARWLNASRGQEIIPAAVMSKAPSAELRLCQTDQDSLPPYEVLDAILELHIEHHQSAEEILAKGFDAQTVCRVLRLVKNAEFKRKQAAPGLKVTDRAFGSGWRMPIACRSW
ncbi:putative NH(3)-dependent NAD(+) synthetase [uncultured archaeon]|nr:putative NH(3)-dependent NAD(+) synthetase [uncultured archaeon]